MKKIHAIRHFTLLLASFLYMSVSAEVVPASPLTLEQCRELALTHNKRIQQAQIGQEKARHEQQAARTNYLPKVSLTAGYTHLGRSLQLLSDERQAALSQIGTALTSSLAPQLQQLAQGILTKHPELAPLLQQGMAAAPALAQRLNGLGQQVADAFTTNTHDVAAGSILLTQPLYMGGKIRAYDRLTRYAERLAEERWRGAQDEVVLEVDQAYWQLASLIQKRRLATSYRDLLAHLLTDVEKMKANGVATRANELAVSVELNKADMTLMKVDDGVKLSQMLLAQLCGLPLHEELTLAEVQLEEQTASPVVAQVDVEQAFEQRTELRQLALGQKMLAEKTRIEQAAFRPTVALVGGVAATYPSLYNGFEKKLAGNWSVGLVLKMPLWTWGENRHKVAAVRAEEAMAQLRQAEAREKIELQVHQRALAVNEAVRKLQLAEKNMEKAEENLRMSKVGHAEGVIPTSDLLAAQTAWLAAHSDCIDAQIDIQLTRSIYKSALGQ